MALKPIHIDHVPKLIKWKNKAAIAEFANRFYSPAVFIVAFLSAFNMISYTYSLPFLILIAFLSSIFVTYTTWNKWKRDFVYLAERETPIPIETTCTVLGAECSLQFMVSIISFWWISKVPQCIQQWTGLERLAQAWTWIVVLILTFVTHIYAWKNSSREMDKCLRETYEHIESSI